MAYVFARGLAIPLWAIAFIAVALTVPSPAALFGLPPATLLVLAVAAFATIALAGSMPRLRRSDARVRPPVPRLKETTRHAI